MTNLLTKKTLTFEEYLLLPYDGKRSEFVDGRIIEMTEPSGLHIAIVRALSRVLDRHIEDEELELECVSGPGVEIPRVGKPNSSRDPDLLVCSPPWPLLYLVKTCCPFAPDLF
ncbi:MAG: Uma2 family endonuclease [Cyanobacteria bacterium P01_D01_bin.44]